MGGAAEASTTFTFTYDGTAFGNTALETGTVTVAGNGLAPGFNLDPILSANVTVTGDGAGDGVFTTADYGGALLTYWSPTALDLSQQLVGQSVSGPCVFGSNGFDPVCGNSVSGDFNLVNVSSSAPNGVWYFTQETSVGDQLALTSLTASVSVPEPGAWAMMLIGFAALGAALRSGRRPLAALG